MLDPLSALSVAAAVVQFVEFGTQLTSRAFEIYQSSDGMLRENVQLHDDTKHLNELGQRLTTLSSDLTAVTRLDADGWSKNEKQLQSMARRCVTTSTELAELLADLQRPQGQAKVVTAIRRAARSINSEKKVKKLQESLQSIKSQMSLHMLVLLHDQLSASFASIRRLTEATDSIRLDAANDLKQQRKDLVSVLNVVYNKSAPPKLQAMYEFEGLDLDPDASKTAISNEDSENLEDLKTKLHAFSETARFLATYQAIMESLVFEEMQARYVQIPAAYADTNIWILQDLKSPFRSWLEHSAGIFWISGKAGSGKSTMMKFLVSHEQTRELLESWAGLTNASKETKVRSLAVGSYYFWASGYAMQKSLRGLFQCLLHHIFEQCPTLMPIACAERWERTVNNQLKPQPWTMEQLSKAVDSLVAIETWPSRFCFFVDGLDEYAGTADEQYTMVQDLRRLTACPFVKICVSSRPWNVFRSEFEDDRSRMIVLQDHNRADLDTYIAGKLEKDSRFQRLASEDSRAPAFAREIRERASGVFLWVFLVVRSLLDGLTEDDDISMLQTRLRALPPTLEQYFDHMLRSIDPTYKQYTARALLLACNATQPLPILSYYYLLAERKNPDYALNAPVKPATPDELHEKRKTVTKWINKWCRDLLEVNKPPAKLRDPTQKYRVEFLHRTAKDFLISTEMQQAFERDAGPTFDTPLSLCRSYLIQTKCLAGLSEGVRPAMVDFVSLAGHVMFHAKEYEVHSNSTPFDLLQKLDNVGGQMERAFSQVHWTCACPRYDSVVPEMHESNFLAYAIEFDLQLYVDRALTETPDSIEKEEGASLATYAIRPTLQHDVFANVGVRKPLKRMLEILQSHGADLDDITCTVDGLPRREEKNGLKINKYVGETQSHYEGRGPIDNPVRYRNFLQGKAAWQEMGTSTPTDSYMARAARGEFASRTGARIVETKEIDCRNTRKRPILPGF